MRQQKGSRPTIYDRDKIRLIINTTYQIGSALSLAITVALASTHTETLTKIGTANLEAINNGFHLAFIGAAIVTAIATTVSLIYTKSSEQIVK
jgi:hypothetical protein